MAERFSPGEPTTPGRATGGVIGFALGQLLFVAVVPDPTAPQRTVTAAALLTVLIAATPGERRRTAVPTAGFFLVLSGLTVGVRWWTAAVWPAALVLGGGIGTLAYVTSRYARAEPSARRGTDE